MLEFINAVSKQYKAMAEKELYVVDISDIYQDYLDSFPAGSNPIYKERTEHDCSTCKQFIRNLGKLVGFDHNGEITSAWSCYNPRYLEDLPFPYNVVAEQMAERVESAEIVSVFRSQERQYGCSHNYDADNNKWNHFHGRVEDRHFTCNPDRVKGDANTTAQLLKTGLQEISLSALETIVEIIEGNGLYRGQEFLSKVRDFRLLKETYESSHDKPVFHWRVYNHKSARFKNSVIGTLALDISKGMDLEKAVGKFESKVAPQNYKRSSALITQGMIDSALATIKELDLEDALDRRFAKIGDVSVRDVLFVDNSVRSEMRDSLRDVLTPQVKTKKHKSSSKPTKISAEDFFDEVVPGSRKIEVIPENRHLSNLVSLTAPQHEDTARLFQWDNDFAWSYTGEVTDSIKQRVKAAGGKIDAKLRVSLAWFNSDDLDLHVSTPSGSKIFYGNKWCRWSGGQLDVDMNVHSVTGNSRSAVENVFWNSNIPDGKYEVFVKNYTNRESIDVGFTLEVEYEGDIKQYSYSKIVPNQRCVKGITLVVRDGRLSEILVDNNLLTVGSVSQEQWGLTTNNPVSVDSLMLSPNHWNGKQQGNKHWFFILRGVKNPDRARGIYNEFLRSDLAKHRKVFEVLGAKTKVQHSDEQLSGLGFSSTKREKLNVLVDSRPYSIEF